MKHEMHRREGTLWVGYRQ